MAFALFTSFFGFFSITTIYQRPAQSGHRKTALLRRPLPTHGRGLALISADFLRFWVLKRVLKSHRLINTRGFPVPVAALKTGANDFGFVARPTY
jgi:hypothetical protein